MKETADERKRRYEVRDLKLSLKILLLNNDILVIMGALKSACEDDGFDGMARWDYAIRHYYGDRSHADGF